MGPIQPPETRAKELLVRVSGSLLLRTSTTFGRCCCSSCSAAEVLLLQGDDVLPISVILVQIQAFQRHTAVAFHLRSQ